MSKEKEYKHSGNMDWGKTIPWFLLGLLSAGVIGVLYGVLSHVIPFIYLKVLFLAGAAFALNYVVAFMVRQSHSRNRILIAVMVGILGVFAWYCSWCMVLAYFFGMDFFSFLISIPDTVDFMEFYIQNIDYRIGSRNSDIPISSIMPVLYLIEFFAFLYPIYGYLKMKHFYCEKCKKNMETKTIYISDMDTVQQNLENIKAGNITFLGNIVPVFKKEDLNGIYRAYAFNFHFCTSCKDVVLYLERISLKKNEKGEVTIADKNDVVKSVYINRESSEVVFSLLELAKLSGYQA